MKPYRTIVVIAMTVVFHWEIGERTLGAESVIHTFSNSSSVASRLPKIQPKWITDSGGSLCGVFAACSALEMIGVKAKPKDFISLKYLGKCGGSTPEEVARIIRDSGAQAQIVNQLSAMDLRVANCPIIANVRNTPSSNRFNHWTVVVPNESGMTVYDTLQDPYQIRTSEFLGNWSGVAILVTNKERNPLLSVWLARAALLQSVLMVGCLVFVTRHRFIGVIESKATTKFLAICMVSAILSIVGNAVFGDLRNHQAGVAVATACNLHGGYRFGTLENAEAASGNPRMLLIDARKSRDYRLGTIPNAVNVPVNASIWGIREYLRSVQSDTPIVVFCQSSQCGYDEKVAQELAALGFLDLTVCTEGWNEYKQRNSIRVAN